MTAAHPKPHNCIRSTIVDIIITCYVDIRNLPRERLEMIKTEQITTVNGL